MAESVPVSAFAIYKKHSVKSKPAKPKRKLKLLTRNLDKTSINCKPSNKIVSPSNSIPNGEVNGTEKLVKKKSKTALIKKRNKLLQRRAGKSKKRLLDTEDSSAFPRKKIAQALESESSPSVSTSSKIQEFYQQPQQVFEWMIAPVKPSDFFKAFWESAPLFIKRQQENYYNQILSTEKLDSILRQNALFYTRNIDVVSYTSGKRETHNPEGRAVPAALWDYYSNGCSIRVLNPHTYCHKLHTVLAALQEYFGCMAGVNAYLTPPGSQGFAPHYDDIEAFVLQLEGRKHWKLYAPLTDEEILPRFSSKNFDRNELSDPLKEVTLEAGDMLYFPRGVIHEGFTDKDAHSLHVTVSVYQRTAYVDLMEHILKPALAAAAREDLDFRKGLPLQYLQHVGTANAENSSQVRTQILTKVQKLFGKMMQYLSVDAAADEMGKQFMWDAMPPVPSKHERLCMVHGESDRMLKGKIYNKAEIHPQLRVRLLRYHCLQLKEDVTEQDTEGTMRIYYCTENAKYYHGEEQQFLVVNETLAPAIKYLLNNYPEFVEVQSLPLEDDVNKMQIVSDLWERGLIVTEQPLEPLSD